MVLVTMHMLDCSDGLIIIFKYLPGPRRLTNQHRKKAVGSLNVDE